MLDKNIIKDCYIGQGFYPTNLPHLVRWLIFENPLWYSPYTPYQAEIS